MLACHTFMKTVGLRALLVFAALSLASCSFFSQKQALAEFQTANPAANVYEHFVGEGDDSAAYMHFRYTISRSDTRLEQMWLCQKQRDGTWRVMAKDGPKPAGSKFGD
jgi:hypothetical protein